MFIFWKIWRALFSCNTHFEIRPFALLPTILRKILYLGLVYCKVLEPVLFHNGVINKCQFGTTN